MSAASVAAVGQPDRASAGGRSSWVGCWPLGVAVAAVVVVVDDAKDIMGRSGIRVTEDECGNPQRVSGGQL